MTWWEERTNSQRLSSDPNTGTVVCSVLTHTYTQLTHTCTFTHMHTHTHAYTHLHTHTYALSHICTCILSHMHTLTHICPHTHAYSQAYAHSHTHTDNRKREYVNKHTEKNFISDR